MDQWVELSRITISGPMTRKEDLLLLSRSYEASEGEEVCDMTSHLIVCMQPVNIFLFVPFVSLLLLHHFSFFLNFFFALRDDYPAFQPSHHLWSRRGAWAIPSTHGRDWCTLRWHARTWVQIPKLFLQSFMYIVAGRGLQSSMVYSDPRLMKN